MVAWTERNGRRRKRAVFPQHHVQHGHDVGNMFRQRDAGSQVLCGATGAGIDGVQIQFAPVMDVRCNDGTCEPLDIRQCIAKPGEVEQVFQGRRPIFAAFGIEHLHRRSAGGEMDTVCVCFEVVDRFLAMQDEPAGGGGDRVLDQRARQQQAPGVVGTASLRPGEIRHRGRRVLHSDSLEQLQRREVDTFHVAVAQRPVHAAWRTGGRRCACGGFPWTAAPHQRKRARGSDLRPVRGFPCGPGAGVNRTRKPNTR